MSKRIDLPKPGPQSMELLFSEHRDPTPVASASLMIRGWQNEGTDQKQEESCGAFSEHVLLLDYCSDYWHFCQHLDQAAHVDGYGLPITVVFRYSRDADGKPVRCRRITTDKG
jgi:hypothetical protein